MSSLPPPPPPPPAPHIPHPMPSTTYQDVLFDMQHAIGKVLPRPIFLPDQVGNFTVQGVEQLLADDLLQAIQVTLVRRD